MKAIDWRLRPPFGSFEGAAIFDLSSNFDTMPASAKAFSMEMLIQEMDEAEVVKAVVPLRKESDNDDIGRIQAAYPGRFEGLAHIDPFDGPKALEEIDKYVTNGPAKGIILEPGQIFLQRSLNPNDPLLYPIYEKCQRENILVTLVFGGLFGRGLEYYNPADLDKVARDFPDMNLVLTHGGWPYTTETCWIAYHRPKVTLSPDYWMMSMNPGHEDYAVAVNNYLKNQMVFGSVYPASGLKWAIEDLRRIGVKEEVMPNLLYNNAAKLLKLDEEE